MDAAMEVDAVGERFVVEIRPTPDGRVVGTVGRPGSADRVPFSGWMDLLRLLEPRAPEAVTR
ncbi:hypothetical protein I4I73_13530 [Pseudonocardia sp. KRD-184]|uniref:DUF397 domain-containing protein n=1 Tax=Pseudonocardia oceani TaxID=2792013 RepID=A0ABS6UET8_9PSEU|nr:hypothetical protein [Pseudonocardia oceani]MBW0093327.1 hypothetical protein [Pseudonocardia oceani]MBW0097009.1 hypothetical protein [Pseudonocardia oceani]MBW0123763.1 hypothetical protein [Pseudonocardia oceani]MBW0130762.1 hypothetical protein [Pseudonocardia oceani]